MPAHGLLGVPDAGAFLARLTRLDRSVVVRLRSAGDRTALWAQLPWNVLVTREVAGPGPGDATVSAAELLNALAQGDEALPVRRALLDHVALVVTPASGAPVDVPQRLVQAVTRMGFLGPAGVDGQNIRVCVSGRWVGLSAPYGVGWLPSVKELTVMPIAGHPIG